MSQSQTQIHRNVTAQIAIRRRTPTTARGSRFGVLGSLLFHGLILAALIFTFHRNFKAPEETHVVPVDLVTIADQTNVAASAPKEPEPQKMDTPPRPCSRRPSPSFRTLNPRPSLT